MKRFIFLFFLVSHTEIYICEYDPEYKCVLISDPEKKGPDVVVWESDYELDK